MTKIFYTNSLLDARRICEARNKQSRTMKWAVVMCGQNLWRVESYKPND